jgi:hypothetical protein
MTTLREVIVYIVRPSVTFFAFRSWAGCIISMSGFNLRQAQV